MIDGESENLDGGAPEKELSLDDILSSSLPASYDEAQKLPDDEAGAAEKPAAGAERDEHGRFKARGDAPSDAAAAPDGAQNPDQGQTPAAAPGVDPASVPPASWSAAEKAIWSTLPPDARSVIARREADFATGIAQKAQELKAYEGLESVIGPRRQALAATYGSAEQAISQLFKLSDFAETQPVQFAQWFLQQRGIDPSQIFAAADPGAGHEPQPGNGAAQQPAPEIAAVLSEVAQLKQDLVRAVNEPIVRKAQSELAKFEADPKNVHYQTVKSDMARILANSGREDMTYEEAYDAAIWANPTLRPQLIEAERTKAAKAAAEAAANAKKAGGSRFTSAGSAGNLKPGPRSMDQTLSETFDRVNGA